IVDGTALELLSYSLQYLDEDGKVKSFVQEESIAVTAPNTGKFLYGAVTQMEESDREFHTYMAKRVPHLVTDVENSIRSITEKSKPLAVPNIKNSTISAKVLF
ncbi:MAG: major capsid protein, partial [Gallintestinimicrobium sp.]